MINNNTNGFGQNKSLAIYSATFHEFDASGNLVDVVSGVCTIRKPGARCTSRTIFKNQSTRPTRSLNNARTLPTGRLSKVTMRIVQRMNCEIRFIMDSSEDDVWYDGMALCRRSSAWSVEVRRKWTGLRLCGEVEVKAARCPPFGRDAIYMQRMERSKTTAERTREIFTKYIFFWRRELNLPRKGDDPDSRKRRQICNRFFETSTSWLLSALKRLRTFLRSDWGNFDKVLQPSKSGGWWERNTNNCNHNSCV